MAVGCIVIGGDMDIGYEGAKASRTGAYLNSGTCTYEVFDSVGTSLATGTLDYEAASNGNYYGAIPSTVTDPMTEGDFYTVVITFVDGSYNDVRYITEPAVRRT